MGDNACSSVQAMQSSPTRALNFLQFLQCASAYVLHNLFMHNYFTLCESFKCITALLHLTGLRGIDVCEKAKEKYPSVYALIDARESNLYNVYRTLLRRTYWGMARLSPIYEQAVARRSICEWHAFYMQLYIVEDFFSQLSIQCGLKVHDTHYCLVLRRVHRDANKLYFSNFQKHLLGDLNYDWKKKFKRIDEVPGVEISFLLRLREGVVSKCFPILAPDDIYGENLITGVLDYATNLNERINEVCVCVDTNIMTMNNMHALQINHINYACLFRTLRIDDYLFARLAHRVYFPHIERLVPVLKNTFLCEHGEKYEWLTQFMIAHDYAYESEVHLSIAKHIHQYREVVNYATTCRWFNIDENPCAQRACYVATDDMVEKITKLLEEGKMDIRVRSPIFHFIEMERLKEKPAVQKMVMMHKKNFMKPFNCLCTLDVLRNNTTFLVPSNFAQRNDASFYDVYGCVFLQILDLNEKYLNKVCTLLKERADAYFFAAAECRLFHTEKSYCRRCGYDPVADSALRDYLGTPREIAPIFHADLSLLPRASVRRAIDDFFDGPAPQNLLTLPNALAPARREATAADWGLPSDTGGSTRAEKKKAKKERQAQWTRK